MFCSNLLRNERIIDDSTDSIAAIPPGMSTGYRGMFRSAAIADGFSALPSTLMIDRSEWQARIQEMEERKSRVSDLIIQARLPPKDQANTNYCWIFAPTHGIEVARVIQGQRPVSLSPASAGAQIKGFRNEGGWGDEGLQWIAEHGLVPSEDWPDTAIDQQYATQQNKATALEYRATEWDRLQPRSVEQLVSALLNRKPVAIGLNWWAHEVLAVDAMWLDGDIAIRCRNSWGDRPDYPNGFFVLRGRKMIPDDAVSCRSTTAS